MNFSNCPVCQGLIQATDTACPICRTPVGAPVPTPVPAGPPPAPVPTPGAPTGGLPPPPPVVPATPWSAPPAGYVPPAGNTPPPDLGQPAAAPPGHAPAGHAPAGYAPPGYGPPGYAPPGAGGPPPYGAPPGAWSSPGAWSPPSPPKRPAATVLILLAVVIAILGVAVVGAAVLIIGRNQYPSSWDPRVADITDFVQKARGMDYKHPVYVDFLTEDEFNQTVTKPTTGLSDTDKQALSDEVASYRALGLIQGDVDLVAQQNQLQQSGTLAFYDPKTKRVRVRGTELDVAHKVTLAHELTHALQDQYFDLTRLGQLPNAEAQNAFRTVVEGDAVRVENLYIDQLSATDKDAYHAQSKQGRDTAEAGISSVPDVLVASISAPYEFGTPFLSVLKAKGGNTTINDAITTPPPNEAQIVDPDDFFSRRKPADVAAPAVPAGADKITVPGQPADQSGDDHLGSLVYFMMLSARVDPHQALQALDVWNGDALVSYHQDGRLCVKVAEAVDDSQAADLVAPILDQWAAAMPPESAASVARNGDAFELTTCDPGAGADVKISGKPSEALALPAVRLSIWGAALDNDVPPPKASCIAKGFTDQLPLDEAINENPDKTDIQKRLSDARSACA